MWHHVICTFNGPNSTEIFSKTFNLTKYQNKWVSTGFHRFIKIPASTHSATLSGERFTFHPITFSGMVCFSTNQCIRDNILCSHIPLELTASLVSHTFHHCHHGGTLFVLSRGVCVLLETYHPGYPMCFYCTSCTSKIYSPFTKFNFPFSRYTWGESSVWWSQWLRDFT